MDFSLIGIKTLQLLCCLSLLVVLHEGGHFFFAKLFKVRVEKFYMFFNPMFHLFSTRDNWFTRLFPYFKDNETEYGIGWIPLGGYVKIAGMVDESMDTEQMKQPAQPDEFRSQPVWKRFFIMIGGVLVNLIAAFVIFSAIRFVWGEDRLPMRGFLKGFEFNAAAEKIGFCDGDIPVSIDGEEIEGFSVMLMRDLSNAHEVKVLRDGAEVTIQMPEDGLDMLEMIEMDPAFMAPCIPSIIGEVKAGTPAAEAGIEQGSQLLSVNGEPIDSWYDYDCIAAVRNDQLASENCTRADSLALREVQLVVLRPDGQTKDTLDICLTEEYRLGVARVTPDDYVTKEHIDYTLLSCIPAGVRYGWQQLTGYVNDLKYVVTPKGAQSVGSFITIGSIFPDAWDWHRFWALTAFISIILAVMNILPIPGLDGGHVMILLYEALTGHEPSEKVMEWIEWIGLGILGALMLLAFGNDIVRFVLPLFGF